MGRVHESLLHAKKDGGNYAELAKTGATSRNVKLRKAHFDLCFVIDLVSSDFSLDNHPQALAHHCFPSIYQ
jgi:hypothetical protein